MTTTLTKQADPATEMTEATHTQPMAETASTREEGRYMTPPVDIYETDDTLVVVADVPGARREDLVLRVDEGILTIEARTAYTRPEDPVHREFDLATYHRQFRLSDTVDTERIAADLKHGVLRVRLPKAERMRPRTIEVKVG